MSDERKGGKREGKKEVVEVLCTLIAHRKERKLVTEIHVKKTVWQMEKK